MWNMDGNGLHPRDNEGRLSGREGRKIMLIGSQAGVYHPGERVGTPTPQALNGVRSEDFRNM